MRPEFNIVSENSMINVLIYTHSFHRLTNYITEIFPHTGRPLLRHARMQTSFQTSRVAVERARMGRSSQNQKTPCSHFCSSTSSPSLQNYIFPPRHKRPSQAVAPIFSFGMIANTVPARPKTLQMIIKNQSKIFSFLEISFASLLKSLK